MEIKSEMTFTFKDYAIFASGQGSNALSLIKIGVEENCPPKFLVANKEDAPILESAKSFNIPTFYIPAQKKGVDPQFEREALKLCKDFKVSWILLAGFLKVLSGEFVGHFNNGQFSQMINIHPSLLPLYPGLGGYKKAFINKDEVFGHTIHLVTEGVDEGPILYQKELKNNLSWDLETLQEVGKSHENQSYAMVLRSLLKNGLLFKDGSAFLGNDINSNFDYEINRNEL